ncbi:hypothetical protein O1D78_003665 [Vibrio cholerae]|nr:hypothetical protein [Vibrio cholerae]EKF9918400.1 hypothetical protein [Vibrio cholerae]EKF9925730.1 hypothetical protein [Vibrio cholerae]EKG0031802.1 hypothetical protein [Vibrio cholerae]
MVEKIGHIKNPLTVIAIFAAIAEISGTTVLPFIDPKNQEIYIWFLMLFPTLLVCIFFLTLNFNHKVLYAPSDYKDENHFVNLFPKASVEQQEAKLREEVEEVQAESEIDKPKDKTSKLNPHSNKVVQNNYRRTLMGEVALAEKLAVNSLSRNLGLRLKTDVTFNGQPFDAIGVSNDTIHAVEVKLFRAKMVDFSRLTKVLERAEIAASHSANSFDSKNFVLHVIAVMDTPHLEKGMFEHGFKQFSERFKVKVKLHVTSLEELQNQYSYT